MADSSASPLLSQYDEDINNTSQPQFTFDMIIEQSLSDFGFSQLLQAVLVGIALFFDSQQIFITVFTDAYPTWHCVDRAICDPTASDLCKLPRSAWDWDEPKGKSVISDFGLECSSSLLRGLPTSAVYVGSVLGGLVLVLIPDAFLGRKKLLFSLTLSMSLAGIAVSFVPNIWVYMALKFLIGFARSLIGTYVIVLITERVSTRWRSRVGMIPFTLFVLGFISLSGLAYAVRNSSWRVLYLCTSVPAALYCVFLYIFVLESPRWLNLQGRNDEAIDVLRKLSTARGTHSESIFNRLPLKQETLERGRKYSIRDLFVRKWAFRQILAVTVIMFGLGMSYYGVPLAARDINVNIYLSETLNALVELPSFVLTPFLLENCSRRSSVLVSNLVGGISGILCFLLSVLGRTKTAFAFELATFFSARIGFNLMAVYVVEMFPTCVRNSATTIMRQALVVGGVCSPIFTSLGTNLPSLSFAIFGFSMFVFGLFVLLLPETKGSSLCDTMEEQEQRDQAVKLGVHSCG
ncbi:PREDICTED: organic cation/carnitine transporter 5 [Tarenaya hassleriana]|uniref:organic cation/carnitine transporter 5 n=1 Tax=Tarenaya hassleriana TaxID=28532 RepID=UPI00053C968C|nr:PREDICTED: organic cation/carnitine transporter 5 [Tarenaya hassleriana]